MQSADLSSIHGGSLNWLKWVNSCRLGVYFVSVLLTVLSLNFIKRSMPSTVKETVLALLRANRLPRHIQHNNTRRKPVRCCRATNIPWNSPPHVSSWKCFCTGSPGVVVECQRNLNFLPIKLPTAYCSHSEVTAIFHCICKYFVFVIKFWASSIESAEVHFCCIRQRARGLSA